MEKAEKLYQDPGRMYTFLRGYVTGGSLEQSIVALTYARRKHFGQERDGGVPYVAHPLRMACYLINLDLSYIDKDQLISAALLHDICEDCNIRPNDLPVSEDVRRIVKYLTIMPFPGEEKMETKRRYFTEMLECPEAMVIKGADRIDNLSTMADFTIERIVKNVNETKFFLLPYLKTAKEYYPIYSNVFTHIRNELKRIIMILESFLNK